MAGGGVTVVGEVLEYWYKCAHQEARSATLDPILSAQLVRELDWLLLEVSDLDRLALRLQTYQDRDQIPLRFDLNELSALWQRRIRERMPIQQLVGTTPWREFSLRVTPDVLIPRPETELMVDLAAQAVECHPSLAGGDWADLGTGSGAIALALAHLWPEATIHAVDVSPAALAVAQANAEGLGVTEQIQFYQGGWWTPLVALKGQLSGIVSNPPYIPSGMVSQLQPEVAWHEPHLALDGGADGLTAIRAIVREAGTYLQSGGLLLLEMMAGQGEAVASLLEQQGKYERIEIHRDWGGCDRFAQAHRI